MSALPYMPLYVADYLADAAHLTTEEHGAYLLLIMTYWQRGKPLPADPDRLARIARLSNERWTDVERTLNDFFLVIDGHWHHKRINAELEKVRDKTEKAKRAGAASASARKATPVQQTLNGRSTDVQQTFNHTDTDTDTEVVREDSMALSAPEIDPGSKAVKEEPEGFDAFWKAYPKRDGNADRKGAVKAFEAARKRADGHEVITQAASRYATHCREKGKIGTEFVKQARSWLNGDLWREWVPQEPVREISETRVYVQTGTDAMDAWDAVYKRTKGKMAPRDQRGGWYFPTEYPAQQEKTA